MREDFDLILQGCRLPDGTVTHLGCRDGRIAEIGAIRDRPAARVVACGGAVVTPGLVEAHIHLDKALLSERTPSLEGTLAEAIRVTGEAKKRFTVEDIRARARAVLDMAVRHGTTAMRGHVEVDPIVGLKGAGGDPAAQGRVCRRAGSAALRLRPGGHLAGAGDRGASGRGSPGRGPIWWAAALTTTATRAVKSRSSSDWRDSSMWMSTSTLLHRPPWSRSTGDFPESRGFGFSSQLRNAPATQKLSRSTRNKMARTTSRTSFDWSTLTGLDSCAMSSALAIAGFDFERRFNAVFFRGAPDFFCIDIMAVVLLNRQVNFDRGLQSSLVKSCSIITSGLCRKADAGESDIQPHVFSTVCGIFSNPSRDWRRQFRCSQHQPPARKDSRARWKL